MIDLGGFTVPLESYRKIRAGLGHLIVFDGFVRLRDGVIRRTGGQLHDVNVAVSVSVTTAVRLMDARLQTKSRRFRTG